MGKVLRMEDYIEGKKKRRMIELLSNIESSLIQFDQLADSLEEIILRGEGDGIGSEMFDRMSFEERRHFRAMFEVIEFRVRDMKDRTMMPEDYWYKPPLR